MSRVDSAALDVQTNEADDRVVAFILDAEGRLAPLDRHPTGGVGDGRAHLTSQGSPMVSGVGRWLMVANAASDESPP